MRDAYWNAKDEFEHDIKELAYGYISPEEFETKWRPRLQDSSPTLHHTQLNENMRDSQSDSALSSKEERR